MDIQLVRDNLRQIDQGNIVRLISDVLLHNIDKIDNYRTDVMYSKDDVVYVYDSVNGKHKLYVCTVNRTVPGAFDATKWDNYEFRFDERSVYTDSQFKATTDATSTCSIGQPLFDYTKDTLNVYHSMRGRLARGIDWNLSSDKLSVVLVGFTLFKNEVLTFEVIK